MNRTLVIGDVHGQYGELLRVLELSKYRDSDKLIFLGDYINRGSRSREVMDLLIDLKNNPDNILLRGNHEEMILKLVEGEYGYMYMWLEYGGGRECLRSYGVDPDSFQFDGESYIFSCDGRTERLDSRDKTREIIRSIFPESHVSLMEDMLSAYETDHYFFCHAGIEKGIALEDQRLYAGYFLLWGDEDFLDDDSDYGKMIIFGHYHMRRPFIGKNKVMIALQNAVAIIDLNGKVIYDSNGNTIKTGNIP
jgi:serine/threonine protein phosphatase 1